MFVALPTPAAAEDISKDDTACGAATHAGDEEARTKRAQSSHGLRRSFSACAGQIAAAQADTTAQLHRSTARSTAADSHGDLRLAPIYYYNVGQLVYRNVWDVTPPGKLHYHCTVGQQVYRDVCNMTPPGSRTMRAMPAEATAWLGEATEAAPPPPPAPDPARMPAGAVAADSEPLGRRWERLHSWSTSCRGRHTQCGLVCKLH
jgi:hypothetical protein